MKMLWLSLNAKFSVTVNWYNWFYIVLYTGSPMINYKIRSRWKQFNKKCHWLFFKIGFNLLGYKTMDIKSYKWCEEQKSEECINTSVLSRYLFINFWLLESIYLNTTHHGKILHKYFNYQFFCTFKIVIY